jgi:dTDP-L-rhamnose 4-epimerase
MKILVTGGAGFIGSNLALYLIAKKCSITVLDNLSPQIHGQDPYKSPLYLAIKDKVKFIYGSVEHKQDWLAALEDAEIVIHLAAETGTGQSMYNIQKYTDVNVTGASILLDILTNTKHTVKKLIIASSRSIYGEGKYECLKHGIIYPSSRNEEDMKLGDFSVKCSLCNKDALLLATDESSKIHPSSIYGVTKQVQEQMFMITGENLGIPVVALRFQNVFGVGQSLSNPYTGILSIFSTRIKNNNVINVFEDGLESRDFVYIDDVVKAIDLTIFNDSADYNVFNVGSGICTDVLTVANTLREHYSSDSLITVGGNYRVGDIRHNYADLTLIREKLGFEPQVSFKQGIEAFTNWVNTQDIQNDLYDNSIAEMKKKGLYI